MVYGCYDTASARSSSPIQPAASQIESKIHAATQHIHARQTVSAVSDVQLRLCGTRDGCVLQVAQQHPHKQVQEENVQQGHQARCRVAP